MIVFFFFDFKYRRIPNKFFWGLFLIAFFLSLIELIDNFNNFKEILINKNIVLIFCLFTVYYLFRIKIFGGADSKLIILLFTLVPYRKMSFNFILFFYAFFSLYYFCIILVLFLINKTEKRGTSFNILFATTDIQNFLKKIFLRTYFGFKELRNLRFYNENKYIIADPDLIYNYIIFRFQILIQYRFPLIAFIILAYISTIFIC